MHNIFMGQQRKRIRNPECCWEDAPSFLPSCSEEQTYVFTRMKLREAFGYVEEVLSPEQYAIFQAVVLEEEDSEICADRVGVPLGTVKSRLSRAREGLRARRSRAEEE
jgi:DNA-directed RNA polymerase specialized sigma24 family protein